MLPFMGAYHYEDYLKDYRVGWTEPDVKKQADIIERYISDPSLQKEVEDSLERLPIEISVDKFRDQIISDTEAFYERIKSC